MTRFAFSVSGLVQAYRTESSRMTPRAPQHLAHERILPVRDNQILEQIDASVLGGDGHFGARLMVCTNFPGSARRAMAGLDHGREVSSALQPSGRRRCLCDGHKSLGFAYWVYYVYLGWKVEGGEWWKQHYGYCTHRVMSASAAMLMMTSRRAPEMPGLRARILPGPGSFEPVRRSCQRTASFSDTDNLSLQNRSETPPCSQLSLKIAFLFALF